MAPPPGVTFPTRRFVATRVDEQTGVETIVIQSTALPNNYTTDQVERQGILQNARNYIANNPGIYRIYSPCNAPSSYYTDDDCIWDSRVSDPF